MLPIRALALGCALGACVTTWSHAQANRAPARLAGDERTLRIFVGPDFRVNRESDAPHFETHVDADPKRPRQLVGASIAEPGGRSVAWRSDDGGFIWRQIRFPGEPQHQRMYASGDPQVAYTKEGTALFVTMSWRSQAKRGRGIDIFRSPDGGVAWDTATFVFGDYSVDHPQLATDRTNGRFAGRSYVTFLHGYPSYDLSIVRSDDDGRTWSAPHRYVASPPEPDGSRFHGVNTLNTIVFRDGTLFFPFSRFDFDTSGRGVGTSGTGAVISRDGGETVGPRIEVFPMRPAKQIGRSDFSMRRGTPQFAVDATNGPFADRLYCVVAEYEGNRLRLMLTTSRDEGEHWTPLRPVTPELPAHASQFQPAIAVNREGVVGIYWFDTRQWPQRERFDVYFTASTDGGETFLPAVRINSAPSNPRGLGNLAPTSGSEGNEQLGATVVVSSMFSYRGSGGDYIGMTADADGVFHPLWPDARSGTYHVWTARVEVAPVVTEPRPSSATMVTLKDKAVLVTDPGWYDAATREMVLPVRVKNVSQDEIVGPLRVTIPSAWQGGPRAGPNAPPAPVFTNAKAIGTAGTPVYFDYSNVLGDRGVLRPGEVSGAIAWRVRFGDSVQEDFLRFTSEISGVLRPATAGAR